MHQLIKTRLLLFLCTAVFFLVGTVHAGAVNYENQDNWAFYGNAAEKMQAVDVFFVGPTAFYGSVAQPNLSLTDETQRQSFLGAVRMEKGIYDTKANFYAPYYRQVGLNVYKLKAEAAAPYFSLAYQDVEDAFTYYLEHLNSDRQFILAGFSQGSDMIVWLLKAKFADAALQKRLIAAYVIGWRVTAEETARYPQLQMAQGEYDTGVIVSFNTEAPGIESSLPVPVKTLGINPLNWKTTDAYADKSLNEGAVFTRYDGSIRKEVPHLTGAYLDPVRGTLKVTDIDAADYPPVLELFQPGEYHIYDYQFFYRNLQSNVIERIDAYQRWMTLRQFLKLAG